VSPVTLVSAAVLLRPAADVGAGSQTAPTEFLLARRPPGKVYAGWWEFPGGKVEAGESFHDALLRELHEELGIAITQATPWLTREFTYPHATVRIRFFRVTAWTGEIHPHEHDAIAWLQSDTAWDAPPAVAPILPANGPIMKGLALPTLCALTHAEEYGVDAELARRRAALANGLRFVQVRDKQLPAAERKRLAQAVVELARPAGAIVVVNDDLALARRVAADGVHLASATLQGSLERPDFAWVGASCHTQDDLEKAAALGLDYALLGPVAPTPTHPQAAGLGWAQFSQMVAHCPLPVFALGGMTPEMMATAWTQGAHGLALMRGWR